MLKAIALQWTVFLKQSLQIGLESSTSEGKTTFLSVAIFEKAECMVNPDRPQNPRADTLDAWPWKMPFVTQSPINLLMHFFWITKDWMRINENMVSLVQDLFSVYMEAPGYLKSVEAGEQNCEAFRPLFAWTGLVRCLEGPNDFVKARGARFRETSCSQHSQHTPFMCFCLSVWVLLEFMYDWVVLFQLSQMLLGPRIVQSKWLTWYRAVDCTLSIAGWTRFVAGSKALGHKIATVPWIL